MSVAGIITGHEVEVCGVERMADGDLLVALITSPSSWVCVRAGREADEIEASWACVHRRVCIPMPPQSALMLDRPVAVASERTQPVPASGQKDEPA